MYVCVRKTMLQNTVDLHAETIHKSDLIAALVTAFCHKVADISQ